MISGVSPAGLHRFLLGGGFIEVANAIKKNLYGFFWSLHLAFLKQSFLASFAIKRYNQKALGILHLCIHSLVFPVFSDVTRN